MNKSYNMNIDTGEKTWLTPPHIIEALGPFDLNPCCPPDDAVAHRNADGALAERRLEG